ncbi:hypothetical protein J1N35_037146, partial [Gossypium stocksii]
ATKNLFCCSVTTRLGKLEVHPNHTCSKVYKNKNLTSVWIDVKRDFCCLVSLTKCGRAKLRALELIKGAHQDQYENIYEYLLELRTQNEGTSSICYLDNRLFQRMYVCLQVCKDGYRRIIRLDGYFLKGYYGLGCHSYLLATIRIDANNGSNPIADAAIESENQAPWLWFLELLALD